MNRFYLGWKGTPWKPELMPEPRAPVNYKDPVKISGYIAEKKVSQQDKAAQQPFYGRIAEWTLIDEGGAVIDDCDYQDAGELLIGAVERVLPADSCLLPGRLVHGLIGLDVKTALRIAAVETMCKESSAIAPFYLWYDRKFCYDPYQALVGSMDPPIPLTDLADFLGCSDAYQCYLESDDSLAQAHLARALTAHSIAHTEIVSVD